MNEYPGNIFIRIVSVTGCVLYSLNTGTIAGWFSKDLDVSGLTKGIYTIQIQTNKTLESNKLIIY